MATNKILGIGIDQVEGLANRLAELGAEDFSKAAIGALNSQIDKTYELARDRITTGVNLTDDYLRRRFAVDKASDKKLEASITARGDRQFMTRLVHYGATMTIVPRTGKGRSRNNGRLGIPQGYKQQGVGVAVKPAGGKYGARLYMLRLRSGSAQGENYGVFYRENGKSKQLYGPSVYQLFATQLRTMDDEITDGLEQALAEEIDKQIERIFK